MTDKEKLLGLLNGCNQIDSLESILNYYLHIYYDDISATQICNLITSLNDCLADKVAELNQMKFVAKERATYLKSYLSGNMWLTEEAAKENIQPQIDNAQAIIDICKH